VKLPGGGGMSTKEFLLGLKGEISRDQVTDIAGSVTYYGILALFPFLLFLVALASVVISPQDAERLVRELSQVAPGQVTQIVGDRIRSLGAQQDVGLLTLGAVGALWAASGAMMALMRALNTAYDVREGRPFWKVRLVAVGMTILAGVIALVAGVVAVATAPLADRIGGPVGTAITWLRLPVAGLLMMLLWALLYWVLPDVEQDFKFITPGSVAGVILWVAASWGFSTYVANFGKYDQTYGPLGGVIVLLLWMWISALVLLVGAEMNALLEHRSAEGKEPGEKRLAGDGGRHRGAAPGEVVAGPAAAAPAAARGEGGDGARHGRRRRSDLVVMRAAHEPHSRLAILLAGLAAGLYAGSRRA
jgi:membrane protein